MGGAQPLAVTMNDGVCLVRRRRPGAPPAPRRAALPRRVDRGPRRGARARRGRPRRRARALSRGAGRRTPRRSSPSCSRRGVEVDIVTDQTSAHDPLQLPARGRRPRRLARLRREEARGVHRPRARRRWPSRSRRWSASSTRGRGGLRLRQLDPRRGASSAATSAPSPSPGFVPAYIRPLFCEGKGPFRWAALSGDPADIAATDQAVLDLFPEQRRAAALDHARRRRSVAFQGLPARICWLGYGERDRAGLAFNDLVASGERGRADRHRPRPPRQRVGRLAVPRDRVDADGSRRDRRLAAAQRAAQHRVGRDVGLDPPRRRRRHRPLASTPARSASPTGRRWPRPEARAGCSPNDPGIGVIRHVDAGYEVAEAIAGAPRRARPDARGLRGAPCSIDRDRRAHDQRPVARRRARVGRLQRRGPGRSTTAGSPGSGRARTRRRARRARRRGRRPRSCPASSTPTPTWSSPATARAEFEARHGRRALRRAAGSPTPWPRRARPRREALLDARAVARSAALRARGRHDRRGQVGLRPHRRRRGAAARRRRRGQPTRSRSSAPTSSPAEYAGRPRRVRRAGLRGDARRPARRSRAGSTSSATPGPSTSTRRARSLERRARGRPGAAPARQPARGHRRRGARASSSARPASTTAPTSAAATSTLAGRVVDRGHARCPARSCSRARRYAAGARAARRRRDRRARDRLQPRHRRTSRRCRS